ncbi:hypothetical protein H6G20_05370 [Desertifilum sp. FACHB-1129]|uniref:hypothetical protein n=1 Tax=unclassified Desertifilum TaxID=2621682 RepID=UPI0016847F6B|nr:MULTISPECIES: hypothetical protein [unclassified Desertifilum]MBD2311113.1 hypothetical protein [Desertifilum sp. FACHB-1129]MBD2323980.1 hypothetical protein [Desertifilum sp. FACHB-866]MBD2333915.1 hypothetical protein [Desertifilum sp. FACHB-868]MDA0211226.1 hypothetical protein [Cyanobacteria bacterium FC1]
MGLTKHRSQTKTNSKDRYITNPKTLQYIAKTIDRACQQAPENTVRSFADFKQLIEESSNSKVGVDICEIDGAVRSFRFYLQDQPSQTTTSRYLAQGTGQDSGEYSPQAIANYFGFGVDEVDNERNRLEPQNSVPLLENDFDEDNFDDEDFDDNFNDDRFIKDEFNDSRNNQNQSVSTTVNRPLDLESRDEFDDDEFYFDSDSLEEESERSNPNSIRANGLYSDALEQIDNAIDLSELPDEGNKVSDQNDPTRQVLRDASFVAQQAATQGSDVNGVNLIGDAATGALMATALLNQLLAEQEDDDSTNNPYIERIKGLIDSYEQVERRIVDLEQQSQGIEKQICSEVQVENQDKVSSRTQKVSQQFDEFSARVEGLEEKISQLEENLNVKPDRSQSPAPKFEETESIDRRLDQLEAYAKYLNERLDKFEGRLNQLQETVDSLVDKQNSQNIDSVEGEKQPASPELSRSEKSRSQSGRTPYRKRQRGQMEL